MTRIVRKMFKSLSKRQKRFRDTPREQDYYRILRIIKDREPSIYNLNEHVFRGEDKETVPCLQKIEKNLYHRKYVNRPWKFIEHVNNAFDFIMEKHTNRAKAYKLAKDYKEVFSCQMDNLMEEMGYCCGRFYYQQPRQIRCAGSVGVRNCIIKEKTFYYRYEDWTYCNICLYKNLKNDKVIIDDDTIVPKSEFLEFYFPERTLEKFVRCSKCFRKFHEICVLYQRVSQQEFFCPQCREIYKLKNIPIRASHVPSTECDECINDFLKLQGINKDDNITIRLLSNMEKVLKVKPKFKSYRKGDDIRYRNCTLFAFFDTGNDTDICFFSVFFQLYMESSTELNRKIAYISYIDSVNLIQSSNRTKIYRLILLGLFKYLNSSGVRQIFLWSCPSNMNQDYIFYKKPSKMKMPNKERLSNWYTELLKLGVKLDIVHSYKGINEYALEQNWKGVEDIPLLEGDLWSTRINEAITTVKKESQKIHKEYEILLKKLAEAKKQRKVDVVKKLKAKLAEINVKELDIDHRTKLWNLLQIQINGFDSEYFIIQLSEQAPNDPTTELLTDIPREWINNRHVLVDFFWEYMLEFSDERQAQFSTQSMLIRVMYESRICILCDEQSPKGVNAELLCERCYINKQLKDKGVEGLHLHPAWLPIVAVEILDTSLDCCDSAQSIEPAMTKQLSPDSGVGSPGYEMVSSLVTESFQRTSTPIGNYYGRRFSTNFSSFKDDDPSLEIENDVPIKETLHGFDGDNGMCSSNSETSNYDISERDVIRIKRKINNRNEIRKRRALCLTVG